jgi:hypothetical protein
MAQPSRKKAEDALLTVLACGATVANAARQCGVSERTVYRRLAEPGFKRRLQEVRADIMQRTLDVLSAGALESAKTLLALQKDLVAAQVRLGAARTVLELGLKLREQADLERRLQALEERWGNAGGRP